MVGSLKIGRFTPNEPGSLCILTFCANQTVHPIGSRLDPIQPAVRFGFDNYALDR